MVISLPLEIYASFIFISPAVTICFNLIIGTSNDKTFPRFYSVFSPRPDIWHGEACEFRKTQLFTISRAYSRRRFSTYSALPLAYGSESRYLYRLVSSHFLTVINAIFRYFRRRPYYFKSIQRAKRHRNPLSTSSETRTNELRLTSIRFMKYLFHN